MLEIRNHKLIALLLCFVMVATSVVQMPMTAFAASTTNMTIVNENGDEVSEVTLVQDEKVSLTVKGNSEEKVQWQIFAEEYDMWIDILGETSEECSLSYAKVANMLDKNDKTKIRVSQGKGESAQYSKDVTISVTDETETIEEAPVMAKFSLKSSARSVAEANVEENGVMAAAEEGEDTPDKYTVVINYLYPNNDIAAAAFAATLAAGSSYTQTIAHPTVQGYVPTPPVPEREGVSFDENGITLNIENIDSDMTINVIYQPTEVNYTILYYHQNIDNDNYVLHDQETKQALTNSQITEVTKEYDGFYQLVFEQPTVAADGSTVVEVYYDRQYYLMFFEMGGGYGTEPIYARYGTSIGDIVEPTRAGFSFVGWAASADSDVEVDLPSTMPAESRTYYAIWAPDSTAKVSVVFWGENADDEKYSYLETVEINVKPGTEFTYSENGTLICGAEEHTHSAACGAACGQPEHSHSASCYTLTCTTEVHESHTNACYTCNAENHTHGTRCYAGVGSSDSAGIGAPSNPSNGTVARRAWSLGDKVIYINGTWYRYTGTTDVGETAPTTCGKTEQTHTHTDACLGCGKDIHSHTDYTGSCYTLTCTTPEHSHSNACGYSCGKSSHTHTDACRMPGSTLDNNLWTFVRSDTVTVAADGSTVVNVYYDRTQKTITFNYDYRNYRYNKVETITAKWGENIGARFLTINSNANGNLWSTSNSGNSPWTSYLQLMPKNNVTYYCRNSSTNVQSAEYYTETLTAGQYQLEYTVNAYYDSNLTISKEDFYEMEGFTYSHGTDGAGKSMPSPGSYGAFKGAKLYYDRASFDLVFNDGYDDVKTESVKYEAPLSAYKGYVPEAPSAYEPGSVQFEGWYMNPECTGEKFDFDNTTMAAEKIILYAKWIPVTHEVTFYKNENTMAEGDVYLGPIEVQHGGRVPDAPDFDELVDGLHFIGWFYKEDGIEKAFDFEGMPVTQDLNVYGKWNSNSLVEYEIHYVNANTNEKIADSTTGSGLAGNTKTFEAKGGTELYAGYQEGWFPVPKSHSLTLTVPDRDENGDLTNVFTFVYEERDAVPYTVKYLEEGTNKVLHPEKKVDDNKNAVVTETFVRIDGYMPDAYQKRLVVNVEEGAVNEIIFYYSKDEQHAYYMISHYVQNIDGVNYTEYASSEAVGNIGETYTADILTIPGFTATEVNDVENGYVTLTEGTLTSEGLHLKVYYNRNDYPYIVMHQEQGSGKVLADPDNGTAMYGTLVKGTPKSLEDYTYVSSSPNNLTINIENLEDGEDPRLNIIHMYYKENQVKINYEADPESGGAVSDKSETLNVLTGYAKGSTATPNSGYEFIGWYDEANKKVSSDRTFVPNKVEGKDGVKRNVAATYTAKFAEKNVEFNYVPVGPDGATGFGTVDPEKETVKAVSGTAVGSKATAGEGYTFVGWYAEKTCANDDLISNDAKYVPAKTEGVYLEGDTFYAKFVENDVTINYVAEAGGTVDLESENLKVYTGEAQGSKAAPVKGFEFIGWYDANGDEVSDNEKFIPKKTDGKNVAATYTAKFSEITIDIHYVLVGDTEGAELTSYSENGDGSIGVISGPVEGSKVIELQKGYTFEGWYTDEACTNKITEGLSEDGYKFTPSKIDDLYVPATYYAKIVEGLAEIKYEAVVIGDHDETYGQVTNTTEGEIGVATGEPKGSTAVKGLGYDFLGWYDNPDGSGTAISTDYTFIPTKATTGDSDLFESTTYYAVFKQQKTTINYVAVGPEDASDFGKVTPNSEELLAITDNAEGSVPSDNDAYKFVGWYEDEACTDLVDPTDGTVASGDNKFTPIKQGGVNVARTYYAKFEERTATFEYIPVTSNGTNKDIGSNVGGKLNDDEGIITETVAVKTETAKGATASANKDYEFIGWFKDPECTAPIEHDDGSISGDNKFTPVKNRVYAEETKRYYALFEEVDVTIRYEVHNSIGGSVNLADSTDKAKSVSETMKIRSGIAKGAEATADPGYVFVGWYKDGLLDTKVSDTVLFTPSQKDGKNVEETYIAKFEEEEVTFNYIPVTKADGSISSEIGGSVSRSEETIQAVSGDPIEVTAAGNEGYTFIGWFIDSNCTVPVNNEAAVNGATIDPVKTDGIYVSDTFYALFEENKVTLNYVPVTEKGAVLTVSNEGGKIDEKTGSVSETVLISTGTPDGATAAAEPDFEFAGWYSDVECNNQISTDAKYVPTKEEGELFVDRTTYYAKFVERQVQIKYEVVAPSDGIGTVDPENESVKILTGEAQGSTAKVTNDVYAFVGWYSDKSCEEEYLLTRDYHFTPQQVEGTDGIKRNVAATYYAKFEEAVTFTYIAVPDNEKGDVGTVSLIGAGDKLKTVSEQVGKVNDVPIGAAANGDPEKGFKFVGWYLDEKCTLPVTSAEANVDGNEIIPVKQGDEYVGDMFYAKFSSTLPHLTINKTGVESQDSGESFLFKVTGPDGFNTTVVIKGNGSVTLKNLELGYYTVSEITSWNVDYTPANNPLFANIATDTDDKEVSFVNTINSHNWLDGSVTLLNLFTPHGIEKYRE